MVLGVLNFSSGTSFAVQFCNTTPIIGSSGNGPASPYPSNITVSGLTGTVTDVNVTLLDVRTTGDNNSPAQHWVEDADIMVSAPNPATNVILMSDAGGNNDVTSGPVVDADLTFDDQAANQLPADTGPLVSGTYRPVDDDDDVGAQTGFETDVWAAPAPTPTNSTTLSTFNGIDPNGTWSLWMVDDQNQSAININGGWCIDIITTGSGPSSSSSSSSTPTTQPTTSSTMATTSSTMATTSTTATTQPTTSTTATTTSTTTTMPTTTSTSTSTTSTSTTSTSTTSTSTTSTSTTLPATTSTSTTLPPGGGPTCDGRTPTILGTAGNDTLVGTPGPDVIGGGPGDDTIYGLGGDDIICGGDGNDLLVGGDGNDRIFGGFGNDQIVGEAGNDVLFGGPGSDRLAGGEGNDTMDGLSEPDQCIGGNGTDTAVNCESVAEVP